ncbi:MAG: methyltransferase domain-containing protein [Actinomycetota bacterium]|nr:methyltransferase domain-containing protein [Actinomycetota bacterium]
MLDIGPGRTVVDLAAGTGKLTRLLLPTGARLIAVEPMPGMRAELARTLPGVDVSDGTAEQMALADDSVDAVVVAQAFHWFDGERALPEIHRVLAPGGGLAMVWNVRDRTVEWVERLTQIMDRHCAGVPRYRSGEWKRAFEAGTLFGPLEFRCYPFDHEVDADTIMDRVRSTSWIAVLAEAERGPLLDEVRALFDGMPDRFPAPYHTELWWTRAR